MIRRMGTSGWSYPGWKERFYPGGLAQREWLSFYAQHFNTVEINMSFYRFPKSHILKSWLEKTPPGFKFTLKANRQITHLKKLRNVKGDVRYFPIAFGSLLLASQFECFLVPSFVGGAFTLLVMWVIIREVVPVPVTIKKT